MSTNVIEAINLQKKYGDVTALRNATFHIGEREIVGFAGDNGAGKSTLMKLVAGSIGHTAGQLLFAGKERQATSPEQARRDGIEIVYQDLALCDNLNVYENIYLGRELVSSVGGIRVLKHSAMRRGAHELLERLGIELTSMLDPVSTLSGGQRQMVAICRATAFQPKLIVMDEPTAALSVGAGQPLLELIRRLPGEGTAVMLVSHRLSDVLTTCSRVYVVRHGEVTTCVESATTSEATLLQLMEGHPDQEAGRPQGSGKSITESGPALPARS
ncbi:ATP-binding cassette domain-containing protein [Saccharopolyspora spinosa]|uniref:Monosaccharide ABC transporter ATP-binding protein (CUT2 family) n=1 Tax=Saccharopolyspora spinosa TaxID=60894 RepID=A0A2N3Y6C5_SACSN|nr:ATP-binding cassette domain-containing protein [Saccharopolyspora spinosa]PKW18492.1 monosaccharide ABC transporter ATP-binding protein (CUT2 family) [Saccharopolyspora spinosa]